MISTTTHRTIDVPLGPGRTVVRLTLSLDSQGRPDALTLACGFGLGPEFIRPSWLSQPMQIPADAIPEVQGALARLLGGSGSEAT